MTTKDKNAQYLLELQKEISDAFRKSHHTRYSFEQLSGINRNTLIRTLDSIDHTTIGTIIRICNALEIEL